MGSASSAASGSQSDTYGECFHSHLHTRRSLSVVPGRLDELQHRRQDARDQRASHGHRDQFGCQESRQLQLRYQCAGEHRWNYGLWYCHWKWPVAVCVCGLVGEQEKNVITTFLSTLPKEKRRIAQLVHPTFRSIHRCLLGISHWMELGKRNPECNPV